MKLQATSNRIAALSAEDELFGRMVGYASGLAAAAAAMAAAVLVTGAGSGVGRVEVILVLAVSAVLAERARVQLSQGTQIEGSISNLPVLFAAVLFGPIAAMIVAASSTLGALKPPYMKRVIYGLSHTLGGGLAGVVCLAASGFVANEVGSLAVSAMLGGLALELADLLFNCFTVYLRGKPVAPLARVLLPLCLVSVPLYMPLVALLAVAYREISPWTLPLFLGPALAAQRLFGLYQAQRRLANDLGVVNERLERANLSFATALVATLDARDQYTAGHSAAVAIYARDIAARMGLSDAEQQLAHLCGLVHDIGKIGLPAGLLEKPGALTLEERRQMQEHSAIGERILAKVDDYAEIATIVRHHHERIDGMGYPDGISGSEIPLISRIIAVADAYNAMTSDRPYRDAMPSRVARIRLAQGVEGQFDTSVVAAFEAVLARATEEYRSGRAPDFTLEEQDTYTRDIARVA